MSVFDDLDAEYRRGWKDCQEFVRKLHIKNSFEISIFIGQAISGDAQSLPTRKALADKGRYIDSKRELEKPF